MMSPLVTLNRSSCAIFHRKKNPPARSIRELKPPDDDPVKGLLGRPLDGAAGVAYRRRRLVARDHLVDAIEILRIVLAFRLRFTDEGRRHQLMVALAVVDLVRLQLDVVGQFEILERRSKLDRIES